MGSVPPLLTFLLVVVAGRIATASAASAAARLFKSFVIAMLACVASGAVA